MLPVLDVSSPQPDDNHRRYTDLLHPIWDVRFSGPTARAQWRRHHGSSWHVSSSTAHVTPSMGLMGRISASDPLRQVTDRN